MTECEKSKKRKMLTIRVTPELAEALKKSVPKGSMNEAIVEALEHKVEAAGNKVEVTADYDALESHAENCRRIMEQKKKALNVKFYAIADVALRKAELKAENLSLIISELVNYPITNDTPFRKEDVHDYIIYLERKCEHEKLLKEIGPIRNAKYGITGITEAESESPAEQPNKEKKKRYINLKDLCSCGKHERKEEHNRRCAYLYDTKYAGRGIDGSLNSQLSTPEGQLKLIRKYFDYNTNVDEKAMIVKYVREHGTTEQKVLVNTYFFWRLFPVPFPECETYLYGKVVTEDLTCQEIRSFLLTKEESALVKIQGDQNKVSSRLDPLAMIAKITNSKYGKYGWMYIDGAQKRILDAYLKEHNLPFPRFKGKHVPLEFAVFNSNFCYGISPQGKRILDREKSEHVDDETEQAEDVLEEDELEEDRETDSTESEVDS